MQGRAVVSHGHVPSALNAVRATNGKLGTHSIPISNLTGAMLSVDRRIVDISPALSGSVATVRAGTPPAFACSRLRSALESLMPSHSGPFPCPRVADVLKGMHDDVIVVDPDAPIKRWLGVSTDEHFNTASPRAVDDPVTLELGSQALQPLLFSVSDLVDEHRRAIGRRHLDD